MSSAGIIAGRSPLSLLGVKGAGLGRRGGVPGAWPFMAAGAATAFRVKTGSSLPAVLVAAGRAPAGCRLQLGLGLCFAQDCVLRRAIGQEIRPPAKLRELVLRLVTYMPLASGLP